MLSSKLDRRVVGTSLCRLLNCLDGLVGLPSVAPDRRHIYNQFVIRAAQRDELRAYMTDQGIGTEIYYPVPLHLQECFRSLGYHAGDFPEAEAASREALALPIFPELRASQQETVVRTIAEALGRLPAGDRPTAQKPTSPESRKDAA